MLGGAIASAGAALGSILSPYALQGYLAGGVSKSSFNNIHWDEKSARLGGCYGAAITFGGLLVGGIYPGYVALAQTYVILEEVMTYSSYVGIAYDIASSDWKSLGADATALIIKKTFNKSAPIGLGLKYAEVSEKYCKGFL
ncbi:hypothetical protein [Leptospira interrogans]|uniref:Uncharacterized protein n=1 Tax=Leptospira interrogans str. FPW1039 TaxID=1193040 RepID=A0A0F6IJP7_LEPIR|nr:hypothetical protein [Leptospira interrogans]EKO85086.1 hypothetical protein LEP1GSC009_0022 [Leptospira interrogans serovar Grippotyphosa str. Andaman]EKP87918.1 hypothetical protein LEP1GSC020_2067 [Leptospira interrogans serovar Grippotyphosa str. 2006006986]EMJ38272.1 hypothetical protein LEP1GSC079_1180 [Leptospira interrogans str. FPW1039]EMN67355.1 hypothetical protein LEP1GSC098_0052 [Leptospira interrogans serovar Grippotyphosa str. UI 08434]